MVEVEASFRAGNMLECYEMIARLVWVMLCVEKVALGSIAGLDG